MPEEKRIDLESLEQKARAASPGPWVVHADGMEFGSSDRSTNPGVDTADGQVVCWWGTGLCGIPQNPDAEFIASANPEAVLAMVEEIRTLRQQLEQQKNASRTITLAGCEYTEDDLIGTAVRCVSGNSRQKTPRWVLMMDAFVCGSGVAQALCRRYGLDPDEGLRK
ncbi:hypothetical protein N5J66_05555 [Pseudomonas juntendi]|uniref:hypothetical protein n=1 Tax=Pseudomonas juntendi TaxID=2666183 RepID=UPI002449C276|nr:hypothetical protein [Pseudomonas juntendi]MDH2013434.1 hypothetical protein [Pseudomonas juntendi]